MPTIVGILIFISGKNVMLNWVEYEKKYDLGARMESKSFKTLCQLMTLIRWFHITNYHYCPYYARCLHTRWEVLLLWSCLFIYSSVIYSSENRRKKTNKQLNPRVKPQGQDLILISKYAILCHNWKFRSISWSPRNNKENVKVSRCF